MPASKLDPRLIHPLLLHVLLDIPGVSNPVAVNIAKLPGPSVPEVLETLNDLACIPKTFQQLFDTKFVQSLRETLAGINSSPQIAVPHIPSDTLEQLVLRMFWATHNLPVHPTLDTSRRTLVFQVRPQYIFRAGKAPAGSKLLRAVSGKFSTIPCMVLLTG